VLSAGARFVIGQIGTERYGGHKSPNGD